MVKLIQELYSVEALADLIIKDINATKKGKYLDFNITVLNEGLVGVEDVKLTILADGGIIEVVDMGEIGVGFGRSLSMINLKLPSRGVDVVEFFIDRENVVRELSETNNVAKMERL